MLSLGPMALVDKIYCEVGVGVEYDSFGGPRITKCGKIARYVKNERTEYPFPNELALCIDHTYMAQDRIKLGEVGD